MSAKFQEVPVEELRVTIDPQSLPFKNTESLEPPGTPVLGQERASDAIDFGIGMKADGYHIFVAGPPALTQFSNQNFRDGYLKTRSMLSRTNSPS